MLCTKWAHFKCDACYRSHNSRDGGMFTMVLSPLFFKTIWRCLGIKVMSFWSFGGPILAWYRFPAAEEFVVVFDVFFITMRQMFPLGEISGLQASQFSTRTLLLQSHAVVTAAVCGFTLSCWNTQGIPWNRRRLEGSICCSKTFIYLSEFIVPSKTCCPCRMYLCTKHTIRDAGLLTVRWYHTGRSLSTGGHSVCDFQQECQIWTRLTIEHVSTLKQSILNEPWPTGHDGASGPCSHMAAFLHDRALVWICRWQTHWADHQKWFPEVFLGPFSNVNDRIMPMTDAVSSEGPKTTDIQ